MMDTRLFLLGIILGYVVSLSSSQGENKDDKKEKIADDFTIDDNWLNVVLKTNVNESSKQYNQVVIDQDPKHIQLSPSDDEDNIEGSGSGNDVISDLETDNILVDHVISLKKESITIKPTSTTKEPRTTIQTNKPAVDGLFSLDDEAPKEAFPPTVGTPSTTQVQLPKTSVPSSEKQKKSISYDIIEVDHELGSGHVSTDEAHNEIHVGSGEGDIISDDEEMQMVTKPSINIQIKDTNCGGISCLYGGSCLSQEGGQTVCVCDMKCENFKGNPVCGTDGMFYENLCHLQLEACSLQVNISLDKQDKCLQDNAAPNNLPRQCKVSYPYWTPWSLWIQSGDKEFRFRYCKRSGSHVLTDDHCRDPQIQVRECSRRESRSCKSIMGRVTEEFEYSCTGVDLTETTRIDEIFPHMLHEVGDCVYSLYEVSSNKFIHQKWTIDDIQLKGDKQKWCTSRDRYIPFHDSKCSSSLHNFCRQIEKCSIKPSINPTGNYKHKCWKKFLLGEQLPTGFPGMTDKYFLCQRLSRKFRSKGAQKSYYGTIYDTEKRIPLMSFGRFSNLSDTSKPIIDFMIEKGLTRIRPKHMKPPVFKSLHGDDWSRGVYPEDTDMPMCERGRLQALNADYKTTEFRIQQLLPYSLTGNDVREKLSTFTLTNAAPIDSSLYKMWEIALDTVRKYSVEKCGIPVLLNPVRRQRTRVSRDHPEMYVISGVVSFDSDKTIGNNVAVPYLFWYAGCCIKGADTSSYAMYARNVPDGIVISAPVAQLEVLLSDLYNATSNETIKIFPAYDDICGSIKSDVSGQIKF